VTRWGSPKLAAYAGLSAVGLLTALVFARPELVALTAPFLLALAAGLALATPPRLEVGVELDAQRALEGDEVDARIVLRSPTPVDRLDVYLRLPPGLEVTGGSNPVALHLAAGERRELEVTLRAVRWGAHVLGPTYTRARDPLGLLAWESSAELRIYPREEVLRRILKPRETQALAGNEVSRAKGEGIEFADIRPFAPGDPLKRVNWRASARRGDGDLWVNESHPERNTDVILFVDSFAEARLEGAGTLDLAVRATATLADAYARQRDRIGLISCARDRTLPAARRTLGRCAARPARARLRPRGDRRLPGAVHEAACARARRGRLRHLAAATRRAATPAPERRRRRR
jgi:uncharacterized protein (DUF58 family)